MFVSNVTVSIPYFFVKSLTYDKSINPFNHSFVINIFIEYTFVRFCMEFHTPFIKAKLGMRKDFLYRFHFKM